MAKSKILALINCVYRIKYITNILQEKIKNNKSPIIRDTNRGCLAQQLLLLLLEPGKVEGDLEFGLEFGPGARASFNGGNGEFATDERDGSGAIAGPKFSGCRFDKSIPGTTRNMG